MKNLRLFPILAALLLGPLAALYAAELPALLDAPSWKPFTAAVPIRDGKAILSLELSPKSVGCVTQTMPKP